jgi:hypothetical protein
MPAIFIKELGQWGPWLVDARQLEGFTLNLYWPGWNQPANWLVQGLQSPAQAKRFTSVENDGGREIWRFGIDANDADFNAKFLTKKISATFHRDNGMWYPYYSIQLSTLLIEDPVLGQLSFDITSRRSM